MLCEEEGDFTTDPGAGTGDEGSFASEVEHVEILPQEYQKCRIVGHLPRELAGQVQS